METIFSTTLKRLELINNLIHDKKFKKLNTFYKKRVYDLDRRLERIAAEMWYRRSVKNKVVKYVRDNYVDLKDIDSSCVLSFTRYDYCSELWNEYFLLIDKKVFDDLVLITAAEEIRRIEEKNLKLF